MLQAWRALPARYLDTAVASKDDELEDAYERASPVAQRFVKRRLEGVVDFLILHGVELHELTALLRDPRKATERASEKTLCEARLFDGKQLVGVGETFTLLHASDGIGTGRRSERRGADATRPEITLRRVSFVAQTLFPPRPEGR